jgi:hypothetical protein
LPQSTSHSHLLLLLLMLLLLLLLLRLLKPIQHCSMAWPAAVEPVYLHLLFKLLAHAIVAHHIG